MAYYDYTPGDVRAQAGQLALSLMDLADRIVVWKAWLDATPDADLIAKGMTSAEILNIKSAATDMNTLVSVLRGTASATQADRSVFVKRLLGPVTY